MKKILIVAVAAMVAVAASAQNLKKNPTIDSRNTKKVMVKDEKKSMLNKSLNTVGFASAAQLVLKQNSFQSKVTNLKTVYSLKNTAMHRAIQPYYNGRGVNYQTKESAQWQMKYGVDEESGEAAFFDVIPLPEEWASLQTIGVIINYNQSTGTITINPQCVVTGETEAGTKIYYFLHSWTSSNGAIVLTLNEDGTIETIPGEDISYSAFSEERFDLSTGGPYMGLVLDIEKVMYTMEGQVVIPTASYQPNGLFLHVGPNVNGSYYKGALIPAYADIYLENRTDLECDKYDWSLQGWKFNDEGTALIEDGDPLTATTKDFTFYSKDNYWDPASLIATLGEGVSEPFTWCSAGKWCAGGSNLGWDEDGDPTYTFTKGNSESGVTLLNTSGVKSVICYQGKPAKPLFFTGISMFVYNFEQTEGKELAMTCKIHKAHRDANGKFYLGELIAQSDIDAENVERGTWMSDKNMVRLHWNDFYVLDEDGLPESLGFLQLDDEFAVVMEGWDQETFSGKPLVLSSYSLGGYSNTYAILPNQETYEGAGWSSTFDVLIGFTDCVYGYMHTTDNTDITIPVEGGEASIHVEPYYKIYVEETEEGAVINNLWLAADSEEMPEWLSFGIANENYDPDWCCDLVFSVAPLEGVEGRTATLKFEQPGSWLTVTVTQGTVTGITTTKTTVKVDKTAPAYNLAGQRVGQGYKGLVIKDGQKMIVK